MSDVETKALLAADATFVGSSNVAQYKTLHGIRSNTWDNSPLPRVFVDDFLPVVPADHRPDAKHHQRLSVSEVLTRAEVERLAELWNLLATEVCSFEFAERMTLMWGELAQLIESKTKRSA